MAPRNARMAGIGGLVDEPYSDVTQFAGMMAATEPLVNEYQQNAAYRKYAQQIQQGGLESIDPNSISSVNDAAAMGRVMKDYTATREAKAAGFAASAKASAAQYANVIYPTIMRMQDAYKSGNMAQFDQIADQLAYAIPAPFRIKSNGDGTFGQWFRSDDANGYVQTGKQLTREQILQMAQGLAAGTQFMPSGVNGQMTPYSQEYVNWAYSHKLASSAGNADSLMFKRPLLDQQGNTVGYCTPLNPNGSADSFNKPTQWILYDTNGMRVGQGTYDMLRMQQLGVKPGQKMKGAGGTGGRRSGSGSAKLTPEEKELQKAEAKAEQERIKEYNKQEATDEKQWFLGKGITFDKDGLAYEQTKETDADGKPVLRGVPREKLNQLREQYRRERKEELEKSAGEAANAYMFQQPQQQQQGGLILPPDLAEREYGPLFDNLAKNAPDVPANTSQQPQPAVQSQQNTAPVQVDPSQAQALPVEQQGYDENALAREHAAFIKNRAAEYLNNAGYSITEQDAIKMAEVDWIRYLQQSLSSSDTDTDEMSVIRDPFGPVRDLETALGKTKRKLAGMFQTWGRNIADEQGRNLYDSSSIN